LRRKILPNLARKTQKRAVEILDKTPVNRYNTLGCVETRGSFVRAGR
jgi:hypothetical protein